MYINIYVYTYIYTYQYIPVYFYVRLREYVQVYLVIVFVLNCMHDFLSGRYFPGSESTTELN